MELVLIDDKAQFDDDLRREMPVLIKEAWRKVRHSLGVYTEAYETDESAWGLSMIEQALEQGDAWLLGFVEGELAACGRIEHVTHNDLPALELHTLSVHPNWQGQGLAAELIDGMEQLARKEGCAYLTLFTSGLLEGLVRFYKRLGFHVYKREPVERFGMRYERVFFDRTVQNIAATS